MSEVWDPLRKKNVALTPEEGVRQWFIELMESQMGIPKTKMMSEASLKFGEGPVQKNFRADIIAYDRQHKPLLVVECKAPEVELSRDVLEQVLCYNMVLGAPYIAITNGKFSYIAHWEGDGFVFLEEAPDYETMLKA